MRVAPRAALSLRMRRASSCGGNQSQTDQAEPSAGCTKANSGPTKTISFNPGRTKPVVQGLYKVNASQTRSKEASKRPSPPRTRIW